MDNLRVGMINFINGLVPDFNFPEIGFKKIYGVPSELNLLLRTGHLSLSPVSSIEYLLNPQHYQILPEICIASKCFAKTVGVFSLFNPTEWNGKKFFLSGFSATSVHLFQVLCRRYLGCEVECVQGNIGGQETLDFAKVIKDFDGILLIGDQVHQFQKKLTLPYHDLCALWEKHTSKPFVFALWLVRADIIPGFTKEINHIHKSLCDSINQGLKHLREIHERSETDWLWGDFHDYFTNSMEYGLGEEEISGLRHFSQDLFSCGLTREVPELIFFNKHSY